MISTALHHLGVDMGGDHTTARPQVLIGPYTNLKVAKLNSQILAQMACNFLIHPRPQNYRQFANNIPKFISREIDKATHHTEGMHGICDQSVILTLPAWMFAFSHAKFIIGRHDLNDIKTSIYRYLPKAKVSSGFEKFVYDTVDAMSKDDGCICDLSPDELSPEQLVTELASAVGVTDSAVIEHAIEQVDPSHDRSGDEGGITSMGASAKAAP